MTVIKKSGKKEEFSPEKLANSLTHAGKDAAQEIDAKSLLLEFGRLVEGKKLITTRQIDIIVYGLLYSQKLTATLEAYTSYDKRDKL